MGDVYGTQHPANYGAMVRAPVHSQTMLIPGHPHHMMMTAPHHMGHGLQVAQSPPLPHHAMDASMGAMQDIHAG